MRGRTLEEASAQMLAKGMNAGRGRHASRRTASSPATGRRHHPLPKARSRHARPADRALRAPRLRRGAAVRHQCLRPVGRRARQGAGDRAAACRRGQGGCRDTAVPRPPASCAISTPCARASRALAIIKGILFDKDGTLVDFNATWFAIGDCWRCEAAGGDRARADGCWPMPAMISPPAASAPIRCSRPAPMPTSWRSGIPTCRQARARHDGRRLRRLHGRDGAAEMRRAAGRHGGDRHAARLRLPARRRHQRFDQRRREDAADARRRADVRRRLRLRRRRQPQAGAGFHHRLLRPHRPAPVRDRHGRRQPPRPRNGAGRRRRPGRRRAVRHRHARDAGADGRRDPGFDRRSAGLSGGRWR